MTKTFSNINANARKSLPVYPSLARYFLYNKIWKMLENFFKVEIWFSNKKVLIFS